MRYLSVCSGIEAASVAWEPLGWKPVGFSDIEAFPRAVLQHRFGAVPVDFDTHRYSPDDPTIPLFGDFTQIQEHHVGPVDLLVGGTPCQSFSLAGKRLGLDDPRGNLAIEFLALAKRVRARWLAWENVPGVLSSWSGDAPSPPLDQEGRWIGGARQGWEADLPETGDFHAFLDLFRECGYRGCYRVLDAQFTRVAGFERAVPQRRRRVFVVGHLGDDARALPVLFDPESLRGNPAPGRGAGQSVAGTLSARTEGGGGLGTDFDLAGGLQPVRATVAARMVAFGEYEIDGTASTTKARDWKDATDLIAEQTSAPISFPANLSGTQEVSKADVSVTLQAKNPTAIAFSCKDNGRDAVDGVSPTLRSMGSYTSHANGGGQMAVAFKAAHFTRGKDGAPSVTAFSLSADADMGDQDNLILAPDAYAFAQNQRGEVRVSEISPPLTCGGGKPGEGYPAIAFQERGRAGGRNLEVQEGVAYALTSPSGGGRRNELNVAFAFQTRIARNDRGQPEEICPTLNGADAGETSDARPVVAISDSLESETWAVRRLTPRECERLQGFPDDWTLIPFGSKTTIADDHLSYLRATYPDITRADAEKLAADAPRNKACGNSMAVNVMRWIGTRIQLVEDLLSSETNPKSERK